MTLNACSTINGIMIIYTTLHDGLFKVAKETEPYIATGSNFQVYDHGV